MLDFFFVVFCVSRVCGILWSQTGQMGEHYFSTWFLGVEVQITFASWQHAELHSAVSIIFFIYLHPGAESKATNCGIWCSNSCTVQVFDTHHLVNPKCKRDVSVLYSHNVTGQTYKSQLIFEHGSLTSILISVSSCLDVLCRWGGHSRDGLSAAICILTPGCVCAPESTITVYRDMTGEAVMIWTFC